jgi:hypothetical protein
VNLSGFPTLHVTGDGVHGKMPSMSMIQIQIGPALYVQQCCVVTSGYKRVEVRDKSKRMDYGTRATIKGEVLRSYNQVTITTVDGKQHILDEKYSEAAFPLLFGSK